MGYELHHAIIVTGVTGGKIFANAHGYASSLFGSGMVSDILLSDNATSTFLIGPDGSHNGRDKSDYFDDIRMHFIEYLEKNKPGHIWYVEVEYGNESKNILSKITSTNC